jgi:hypothetical protein
MWVIRALLDRIVLLIGVVVAGCVPGFIVQYRQRLAGRLDQVMTDLSAFQAIADREQNGSLAQLIQHHLQSNDATFHQEGAALQAMVDQADRLRTMMSALEVDLPHQFVYLLSHPDRSLMHATWGDYRPSFALDLQGVIFALVVGVLLWALFLLLWHGIAWLLRSIVGSTHAPSRTGMR